MTRRERLERKLEKRGEWAANAEQRSTAALNAAHNIGKDIPLGQPNIEGRMTSVYNRIGRNMDKGVEQHKLAEHHRAKAAGLESQLENTIFSDDPDAVEAIEGKIAELEKTQTVMVAANKIVRHKKLLDSEKIEQIMALGLSERCAKNALEPDFCGRIGFPSYALTNNSANIRRYKERLETIKTRQKRQQAAESSASGIIIEGQSYVRITFAEKPERNIITALKEARFYWRGGSWCGSRENIPEILLNDKA